MLKPSSDHHHLMISFATPKSRLERGSIITFMMSRASLTVVCGLILIQSARAFGFAPALHSHVGLKYAANSASTPLAATRRGRMAVGFSRLMTMVAAEPSTEAATSSLLTERYVVCNRFNNKPKKTAAFEKRWAERKSSLARLEGFRFFSLLRRLDRVGDKEMIYPENTPDYMSMTVWENKDNFNAWRKGPAFKEAHGGGTVGGVFDAIFGVITELKGMPKTGIWEGLIPLATPRESSLIQLRQRREDNGMPLADGKANLPTECFVAMNRMTAAPGKEAELEQYWKSRETTLLDSEGFVGFSFLRRDEAAKGKGKALPDDVYNYSTCTVWASYEHFDTWRAKHFAVTEEKNASGQGRGGFGHLLDGKPSAIYWEGTQVIQSQLGF